MLTHTEAISPTAIEIQWQVRLFQQQFKTLVVNFYCFLMLSIVDLEVSRRLNPFV